MSTTAREISAVQSIADLPAQSAESPANEAQARARYFNTGNAFDVKLPEVPDTSFVDEPARAMDPATATGLISCDASAELGCDFAATSPLVLAHYLRIRASESFEQTFNASGVVAYVISGAGRLEVGNEQIEWGAGDVVLLPGGVPHRYSANEHDSVLWLVSNEPQLAFENLQAPAPGHSPTQLVHYPATEIERQIAIIRDVGRDEEIAGSALIFSSADQEDTRNALPTLTVAMNSLLPGTAQRPHRHNSVAVSLIIDGDECYSMIDGRRKNWAPWATTVTPPVSVHSHHNQGDRTAMFLIVQDGGIFYHARAMGFEFIGE